MLHIDIEDPLRVGYIHDDVFYTVRDVDAEYLSFHPTLELTQGSLTLTFGNVRYCFAKKHIQRFCWAASGCTVAFEWDFNTGPKIFNENNERTTTKKPLSLDTIECNAIMVTVLPNQEASIRKFRKISPFCRQTLDVRSQIQHEEQMPEDLPLTVGLYMETLLSMYIPKGRITARFWEILQSLHVDEAVSALVLMKHSKNLILNPTQALLNAVRSLQELDLESWPSQRDACRQKKNELMLVFQVEVTPTKIYVTGPFPEQSNRVVRKYWKHRSHFVRVRFSDEDGSQLHGLNDELKARIKDTLNGITLAGRRYSFLAYSNSQLRSHSCFLFAEIDEPNRCVTADDIISRLGNFPDKTPAKHGARIGQCFTATVGGIRVSVNEIHVMKDVTRNDYVFSDGVGTASYAVMELAQKKLGARYKTPAVPSAIQVRIGGAKGVLSLDDRLPGSGVRLRPSMQKFDSALKELEITDFSRYRPAFLNRQLITLLLSLGAPPKAFEKLHNAMTAEIDKLLRGKGNEKTLNKFTWGHSRDILKVAVGTFGFSDGFLRALINKHCYKAVRNLKRKTKIFLPNSALAFGILDEFSCLEENEVFYQGLTDDGEEIPIVGDVIVHRVPSLHCGDVRKLKAVVRSELSHLHNVVVFSRKGQRPIPNMISGGDLDGDLYSIIGEKSIFPKYTVPPMDYSPSKKTMSKKREYRREDRMNFFAEFIANDNLGKVANTWQAQCEIQEGGAQSEIAIALARVHSTMVDFAKTGISATLPERFKVSLYPDYMGKLGRMSFPAGSFIGWSYRRLDAMYGNPYDDSDFELEADEDLTSYPGNEDWLDEAVDIYEDYCAEMKRLLKDFGASSDVDIISGIFPATPKNRKRGKQVKASDRLTIAFEDIKTRYLARFKKGTKDHDDKLAKASAWYRAVYERSDEKPAFASFAWILCKYLVRIKEDSY